VYFDIKDLYEEAEDKGFPGNYNTNNDSEVFGWALTDSWHHIGNVYFFLLSVYNLIEAGKESSPIIDTKGLIQGKLNFSVEFEIYDSDKKTKLNALEYDSLNELMGRNLMLNIELKKASELNEKYNFKTMCKYVYNESGYETKVIENRKEPEFNYRGEHMQLISNEMVQQLMYNTLTISVYGMIEGKK